LRITNPAPFAPRHAQAPTRDELPPMRPSVTGTSVVFPKTQFRTSLARRPPSAGMIDTNASIQQRTDR
jgi:hypothetical protein